MIEFYLFPFSSQEDFLIPPEKVVVQNLHSFLICEKHPLNYHFDVSKHKIYQKYV